MNEITLVSFSGGRSSGMMLKMISETMNPDKYIVVFNNTGLERSETYDFVQACSVNWNIPIYWLEYTSKEPKYKIVNYDTASRNGEPFADLIDDRGYLPNPVARFCTGKLKVDTTRRFMLALGFEHWDNALGIRWDEKERARKLLAPNRERWEVILPLYEAKVTEAHVYQFWADQPFDLGLHSYQGNCTLCFLKGRKKIAQLIREDPAVADWWIEQEEKTGRTFRIDWPIKLMREKVLSTPLLFDDITDPKISCFCGD